VRRLALDADAIAAWFDPNADHRGLRADYEGGTLTVVGPTRLPGDVLARIAERWHPDAARLARIGTELDRLRLELHEPSTGELAPWIARGLSTEQAAVAAVAAGLDVRLVTDDSELARTASHLVAAG
jgi:predicted nucleic acid-binding protein